MPFATNMFHRCVEQSQGEKVWWFFFIRKGSFYTVFNLMICICVFVLENIFKTAAYKLKDKEENRIRTRQQAKKKKKKSYDMNQIAIS